ncbi:hypothetical protein E2C01_074903 [Portunus trituberculatus]|uniref:Uncharacterized protein n=1 Tax=Portunus trituberculatus TaxID=210409 RepID=A0A5B7IDL6_PORTR|nr:hypothetical protein [Portunus trituberculatus]
MEDEEGWEGGDAVVVLAAVVVVVVVEVEVVVMVEVISPLQSVGGSLAHYGITDNDNRCQIPGGLKQWQVSKAHSNTQGLLGPACRSHCCPRGA